MATPMFPLGSVLLPTMVLPLRVFEPRYRTMMQDVFASDEAVFGVVLIERGSEVGGGDVRTGVGTFARVLRAEQAPNGMWGLVAVGERRFRVREWLADDPYPRAEVEPWPDEDADVDLAPLYDEVRAELRVVLARCAELGVRATPATVELHPSPGIGSFQVTAAAPFGASDRQRLLAAPGASDRLELLRDLLRDEAAFLAARLALDAEVEGDDDAF